MPKIYFVEDDDSIACSVRKHMEKWGYEVYTVSDFRYIFEEFSDIRPDIVLLDITLPFFNGYHWCRRIRAVSQVPIIFISSTSDNMNIVMAMNMGGDDFIAKPFSLDVLTAKVHALMRRTYDFGARADCIEFNGAILDTNEAAVCCGDTKTSLTKNEFRILQTLLENKGKIVSRDELMEKLWQTDSYVDENTLTVNVTRLRKKLFDIGLNDLITTKKGLGYTVE